MIDETASGRGPASGKSGRSEHAGRNRLVVVAVCLAFLAALASPALGGVNGDGNLDVVFANVDGALSRVCLGDGHGGFTCGVVDFGFGPGARAVAIGYIDGDRNLDLVFGLASWHNKVCLGDGDGGFVCGDVSPDSYDTSNVALGDVNGDGDTDAVFSNVERNRVCLGDGGGGFTCSDVSPDTVNTGNVALGDVNDDGDLDAVFANYGAPPAGARNTICLGDGNGGFSCSEVSAISDLSLDVALGDVNHDGDLDALFASHPGDNYGTSSVCLGNGSGKFSCQSIGNEVANTRGLALGDVNEDGDLDVMIANEGNPNRVCFGDGSGGFSCANVSSDVKATWDVGLGDVDRDGHLDAVFANFNSPTGQRNQVCMGDGKGGFSCSDVSSDANVSHRLALAPGHRGTFVDDDFSIFENDIEWLSAEGITKGCGPDLFCPDQLVTRGQMAAFLVRALGYVDDGGGDLFVDDDGTTFEKDIDRLGTAGVTKGCNPPVNDHFCPDSFVTRGQMAAFLRRALEP